MAADEFGGVFHRYELVMLPGAPASGELGIALAIKAGGVPVKNRLLGPDADCPRASKIQANLNAFRVKAFPPVKFGRGAKVVPLEADSQLLEAAVKVAPACADAAPGARLGKGDFRRRSMGRRANIQGTACHNGSTFLRLSRISSEGQ